MMSSHNTRRVTTALVMGAAFALPATTWAQAPRTGPGISSGSGAGTGTGTEAGSGLGTTGTGTESGSGLGTTGTGMQPGSRRSDRNMPMPGAREIGIGGQQFGPAPFGSELTPKELSEIYNQQIERARSIGQPGERAFAFDRIARSAVFTNRLDVAHTALEEARPAALLEPMRMVRDQRIMAIINALMSLAEAQVREGMTDEFVREESPAKTPPGRPLEERMSWLERAEIEWEHAADLAHRLSNVNFRTQVLYQVVKSQAGGSQVIANQVQRASYANTNLVQQAGPLNAAADRTLVLAAAHSRLIERPVWRDRALVEVAANAAISNQFERGLEIARTVPQPEVRTDGLLRIAEAQARRQKNEAATATYAEAARSVASIPQKDPRSILAGVLIDSLVSVGRFDDARASIILYPDYSSQILALGAIVESQGGRGRADAARAWIASEAPREYRSYLYRRVNDGVMGAVDKNRSNALTITTPRS